MASFSEEVYPSAIRYSAAAIKSSKTFCFFSNIPCWCHSSPYSPPPRRLGIAYTPPFSNNIKLDTEKEGPMLMLNPPYPYNNVGLDPSISIPFLWTINIETGVPSLLLYHTCFSSYSLGSKSRLDGKTTSDSELSKLYRKTVVGYVNEVNA